MRILHRIAADIEELARARTISDTGFAAKETNPVERLRRQLGEPEIARPSGPLSVPQGRRAWHRYEQAMQRAGLTHHSTPTATSVPTSTKIPGHTVQQTERNSDTHSAPLPRRPEAVEHQLRYAQESVELADRPDADPLTRTAVFYNLAFSIWDAGEQERAVGLNRILARSALEMGVIVSSGVAFLQAGLFASVRGDSERTAMLYGAGDRYFVMQKPPFYNRQLQPGINHQLQPGIAAAAETLGEERYLQSYEQGRAVSVEEATEFLLTDSSAPQIMPATTPRP